MSTEIYEFATGFWRPGPEVPLGVANGASVQFRGTFLLVGGQDLVQNPMGSVIEFVPRPDEKWEYLNDTLTTMRAGAVGIMMHEDTVTC